MAERRGESPGFVWAYRDLLTELMVVFMALGLLAIIASQQITKLEGVHPGQLFIQMSWKTGSKSDIDLWLLGPDDRSIGYARSAGKYCDLLRDELGSTASKASHAIELMVCRDPPVGEYNVNVMDYDDHGSKDLPMSVEVEISKPDKAGHMKELFKKTVTLERQGHEITVVRFELDKETNIVEGSVNNLPHMIRTADPTAGTSPGIPNPPTGAPRP
jgi:hypothetical protein